MKGPRLPIPETLRGTDSHPFPRDSITNRYVVMVRRVLAEQDWPAEISARLETLIDEIPYGYLHPINDPGAPDTKVWKNYISPYQGQNWLEAPWFVVETWFFRRILEATGYFQPGSGQGIDPYGPQKEAGLDGTPESIRAVCAQLDSWQAAPPAEVEAALCQLLRTAIWGNQADLSMWPTGGKELPDRPDETDANDHLLVDDAPAASQYLLQAEGNPKRVDFILDNVGLELAYDLVLADFLLGAHLAGEVRFHAKPHPTYVSDATIQDVLDMIAFLKKEDEPTVASLGERCKSYLADGRLVLQDHYFWTSPLSCWEMPEGLYQELSRSYLLISKGDANYRRWLGDRHWPFTTPINDILSYAPSPFLALRVSKANLVAGLRAGQAETLDRQDPDWLFNGKWGMIQFSG